MIIQKYVGTEYNEKLTSLNHFDFYLPKKEAEADAKIPDCGGPESVSGTQEIREILYNLHPDLGNIFLYYWCIQVYCFEIR